MGARAVVVEENPISFVQVCSFFPTRTRRLSLCVCVCVDSITDRVVASRLGRGPPDPHTHTQKNMKKKTKKNKFLFLFCQFFSSFWFTFYDGDYDFLSARIIVVAVVAVVVAEEADIFLFSRTGCNPDENELFGGRNKQQCQRELMSQTKILMSVFLLSSGRPGSHSHGRSKSAGNCCTIFVFSFFFFLVM